MINILSYVGMSMQNELCLWTVVGLVRTIFDATLFRVNSNLIQVWQMWMPAELSVPVQRALRTVISAVMLVQCFTVYVYLASYIVLLYPVFLEERPTLVLPWLLLAAIRKLLCELTSLSLGLGTCVLLGPARPPCIRFLVVKVVSIMPAFYMWMLVYSYYHILKMASAFKTFPPVLLSTDLDYGLELAVRRRRTKSLFGEEQLRRKLEASFYSERNISLVDNAALNLPSMEHSSRMPSSTDTSREDTNENTDASQLMPVASNPIYDVAGPTTVEDWFGNEVVIPRDSDRVLEQFVVMLLRINIYMREEGSEALTLQSANPRSNTVAIRTDLDCQVTSSDSETPATGRIRQDCRPSYLRDYPEMFTRKPSEVPLSSRKKGTIKTVQSSYESDGNVTKQYKRAVTINSNEKISLEVQRVINRRTQINNNSRQKDLTMEHRHTLNNNEGTSNSKELEKNVLRNKQSDEDDKSIHLSGDLRIDDKDINGNTSGNDKYTEEDTTQEKPLVNDSQALNSLQEQPSNIESKHSEDNDSSEK